MIEWTKVLASKKASYIKNDEVLMALVQTHKYDVLAKLFFSSKFFVCLSLRAQVKHKNSKEVHY